MNKVSKSAVGHGLASQAQIKVGEILEVTRVELLASQVCQKCLLPMTTARAGAGVPCN